MATRGAIGFRTTKDINTTDNIFCIYNHYDSYYEGLGKEVLSIYKDNTKEDFLEMFSKKVWSKKVQNEVEGDLFTKKADCFNNDTDFFIDGLMCEYSYLYNLETDELEIYRGFENEPSYEGQKGYLAHYSQEMFYNNYKFSVTRDNLQEMVELFKENALVKNYIAEINV